MTTEGVGFNPESYTQPKEATPKESDTPSQFKTDLLPAKIESEKDWEAIQVWVQSISLDYQEFDPNKEGGRLSDEATGDTEENLRQYNAALDAQKQGIEEASDALRQRAVTDPSASVSDMISIVMRYAKNYRFSRAQLANFAGEIIRSHYREQIEPSQKAA